MFLHLKSFHLFQWYQLAAVFAMKLSTTTIGITVWDLFVITKPIILTVRKKFNETDDPKIVCFQIILDTFFDHYLFNVVG